VKSLGKTYRDRRWGILALSLTCFLATVRLSIQAQDVQNHDQQSTPPADAQQSQPQPAQNPPQQNQQPQPPAQTDADKDRDKDKKDTDKKDDSPNPAQAAAEKTKEVTINALVKVRDWENGWFTTPYISRNRDRVPLTNQERREIYLQQTLAQPGDYFKRMISAAFDQARDAPAQWPQGWGGYGERFASREGQFIAANSLAALGNAALKYEPRYDQCRCSGFAQRTRHAILRNFVTYDHGEQNLHPQWALYGGAFAGGLISTTWKPHPRNAWTNAGYGVLGQAAWGSLLNFFTEFAGDINRKLGARKKHE
jgi:hypothetical protein